MSLECRCDAGGGRGASGVERWGGFRGATQVVCFAESRGDGMVSIIMLLK